MNNVQQKKIHILKNKKTFVKSLQGFGYKKREEIEFDTFCAAK